MFSIGNMSKSLKLSSLYISSRPCRMRNDSFVLYLKGQFFPFYFIPLSILFPSFFVPFGAGDRQLLFFDGVLFLTADPFLLANSIQIIVMLKQQAIYNMDQQLSNNKERFVFPGEVVDAEEKRYNPNAFYQEGTRLRSLYFGFLVEESTATRPYVDLIRKPTTYLPEVNQFVVGVIRNKMGEGFIVDINAPQDALLGGLQFDGASKRNRPALNPGDIVFARVSEYSRFLGSRLSCLNPGFSAKGALGQLKNGMIVYGLRGREKQLGARLQILGKYCQFEVALGKNDVLWFSCSNPNTQMVLYNIFNELLKGCSQQLFQNLLKLLPHQ